MMARPTPAKRPRPGDQGFTLVEMLITLVLLSMILAMLFGGFRFGTRVWERQQAHGGGATDIGAVQDALRRWLQQAYPLYVAGDRAHSHVDFQGRADELSLLAPAPIALEHGGFARLKLRTVARGDGRNALVLSARPELTFADSRSAETDENVLLGLASVEFSYFGADGADDPPRWRDRWEGMQGLPVLVRVSVVFPPGDSRFWPELVVAPRLSVDAACDYDPLNKSCRGR